jgi:hypothetical protein
VAPTAKEIDRHLQQSARLSLNQLTVSIELSEIELTARFDPQQV